MVAMGGTGYHLPPGATIILVSVNDRFRVNGQTIKRRLYTVRVAFDVGDPALAAGSTFATRVLQPSPLAIADACSATLAASSAASTTPGNLDDA